MSFGRGAIRENPGHRDFKIFFTAEFSHFLVTICFTGVLIGGKPYVKILGTGISNTGTGKKNPGYRDFKYRYWKEILGTGISNTVLEKKILGTGIPKSWYWKKILGNGISNPVLKTV